MANLLALVRSMIDNGASVEEIVTTLREMGVPEDDARRLILLAHRDMLLTLRNELRDIVRNVLVEEEERVFETLKKDLRTYIDAQLKLVNRNLLRFLKKEMDHYIAELSKMEERLSILEKHLLDIEATVLGGGKRIRVKERNWLLGGLLIGFGIIAIGVALISSFDLAFRVALAVLGLILLVGGVILVA